MLIHGLHATGATSLGNYFGTLDTLTLHLTLLASTDFGIVLDRSRGLSLDYGIEPCLPLTFPLSCPVWIRRYAD